MPGVVVLRVWLVISWVEFQVDLACIRLGAAPAHCESELNANFSLCVDCCLFLKYDLKYAVVSGVKLNSCCNLCISFVCEIVSYAYCECRVT